MPAASLASLADSKVSNFKNSQKAEIPKKHKILKNSEIPKKHKILKNSEIPKKHKIPKKAENNEILKIMNFQKIMKFSK